jgi:hypothetical protein
MAAFNPRAVLAQNNTTTQTSEAVGVTEPAAQENNPVLNPSSSDIQWLWGEVSSIDTQKNEITIKYLDYETDTEKEIKISVDETVVYDNVKSINDIKTDDIISVDYVFSPDGRYIAKNISIEKPEDKSELQKKVTGEVENLTNAAIPVTP